MNICEFLCEIDPLIASMIVIGVAIPVVILILVIAALVFSGRSQDAEAGEPHVHDR